MIDAVSLHELSHVRRGDFGWNLVRRVVQVVYWPHSLTWPLGRMIGAVREQARDDLRIHVLGEASAYRASLLEIASGLVSRPDPALGLAMARSTNLGRRLAWIDRSQGASRCLMPAPGRLAIAASVLAVAGAVGSIKLARATASEEPPQPAPTSTPPPRSVEIVVKGQDTGKPLACATVRSSFDFAHREQKADANGRAVVDLSKRAFEETYGADVWADGYVQQRFHFSQTDPRSPKLPKQLDVALIPGEETLGGTVTDEASRPIAGAKVKVWGYLGEKKEPNELAYKVDATTDAQGRRRARNFRGMTFAYLYISHSEYLVDDDLPERRHGSPDPSQPVPLLRGGSASLAPTIPGRAASRWSPCILKDTPKRRSPRSRPIRRSGCSRGDASKGRRGSAASRSRAPRSGTAPSGRAPARPARLSRRRRRPTRRGGSSFRSPWPATPGSRGGTKATGSPACSWRSSPARRRRPTSAAGGEP